MEYLPNGFALEVPPGVFPLSTDSMALAHFVRLPRNARVLDLGSGCGTLGLLLCSVNAGCQVTGVEVDPIAHQAALENIRRNQLESRMQSICMDLRQVSGIFPPSSFSCCVSNPPYFSGGPASLTHAAARREDNCSAEELLRSAAWALKFGGDLFLVHRPERLGELIALADRAGLTAKRLCLLRHREGGHVSLILLQLRKGAKPGLHWEEWCLTDSQGNPTPISCAIYHRKDVS